MISTHGLNHLALPVTDPQQSARFYSELFDMEVTSSWHRFFTKIHPGR